MYRLMLLDLNVVVIFIYSIFCSALFVVVVENHSYTKIGMVFLESSLCFSSQMVFPGKKWV